MDDRRLTLRDRIIGVLLRHTRRQDGRTKAECADALGVSANTIDAYEEGRKPISLPELEVLGYVLDTPVVDFLEREPELRARADGSDSQAILRLRQRIIGVLLRQARLDCGMSQEELAELLGCSSKRIADYEHSKRPIPVTELEALARHLDVPLEHFLDGEKGPVGEWHRQERIDRNFHGLPTELQMFVTNPVNIKYLELAVKLSEMPVSKLRGIAEGLLEIAC